MKSHPALGHEIAIKNGMGYPDKQQGDEITLFPRIIGICIDNKL
ncbi:hypothetical protein [Candidatus Sulfurimonas marisnigri]|nr:hypothetical protein [Candidatus Sulfurimonas marisnigri]